MVKQMSTNYSTNFVYKIQSGEYIAYVYKKNSNKYR